MPRWLGGGHYRLMIDDLPETDDTPARVVQYYDRRTRSYITYLVTKSGAQVGDAEYDGNKDAAKISKRRLEQRLNG